MSRPADRLERRALPSCDQSQSDSAGDFAVAAKAADEALGVGQRPALRYSLVAVVELVAHFEVATCAAARYSGRGRSLPAPFDRHEIEALEVLEVLEALEAVHVGPLPLALAVAVSALGQWLHPQRLWVVVEVARSEPRQHHEFP